MSKAKCYNGKTLTEWANEYKISRNFIADRIKRGWSIEEAVLIPKGELRQKEKSINQIAIENKISSKTLRNRIAKGMSIEEALTLQNKIDYVGRKYNRLFVEKEIDPKRDKNGRARRQFLCLCDCGNHTTALAEHLVSGNKKSCGCYKKELISKKREKILIGQKFFRLLVESEAYRDSLGIHWNCLCDCGNKCVVIGNNLLSGTTKSCGCYNKEQTSKREKAEIQGRRFSRLIAEECVGQNAYKNYLWRCRCDCGTYVVVPATRLLTGETQSCGCMSSRGEEKISKYLSSKDIYFTKGKFFPDLVYNGVLKFDFELFDQNYNSHLIEYQGIQHYEKQTSGFGDQQREITDQMKKDYCSKNNIPLYEIRYDDNIELKMNEIIAHVNPVLSSEYSEKV